MVAKVLIVLSIFAAASSADEREKRGSRGTIVAVAAAKGEAKARRLGSIEVDCDREKLVFLVTTKTKLEKVAGGKSRPCTFADLKKGDKVEIEHNGVFAASNPLQTGAYRVVILERIK
jgi:hypothetical protein